MKILYLEPFHAGSHAAFTHTLTTGVKADWTLGTLPGRFWKWRMRGAAVYFATACPALWTDPYDLVFASSYLPLAELIGLQPALQRVPRVLYFHENQLTFPVREDRERDHHFGMTQLVSARVADRCVFNSAHNRDGFLHAGRELLARMPDAVPPDWMDTIASRAEVIPVPLPLADQPPPLAAVDRSAGPVILWNHRWEHDKGPEVFFRALRHLVDAQVPFRVIVCGHRFRNTPPVFDAARTWLAAHILHWGTAPDRSSYEALLARADIAVSTAEHEFFGIAMLEATHWGAYPLVPNRLSYPEIFPATYRYDCDQALIEQLVHLCRSYVQGTTLRADRREITLPYATQHILPRFGECFDALLETKG